MTPQERIAALERSAALLNEAADIIEECLHMSGMEQRFGDVPDRIREIASSGDAESVRNLIRELEYQDEEHPGWTRPFDSPKNMM